MHGWDFGSSLVDVYGLILGKQKHPKFFYFP